MKSLEIPELRFRCTECGKCCTQRGEYAYVYVDSQEVAALASHLGVTQAALRRDYTFVDELGWRQVRFPEGRCVFLDPVFQRCNVYAARPVQCRTFPFWNELIGKRGWRQAARELCEGVGNGDPVAKKEVAASTAAMAARNGDED